jgi:hypothetical protein
VLDVLRPGTFRGLGYFEAWDILRLWTFCDWEVLGLGYFEALDVL